MRLASTPLPLLALLAASCLEPTLTSSNQPPVGVIQQPGDEASFPAGTAVEFVGKVTDDGALEDLEVSWLDNGTPMHEGVLIPDDDGFVRLTRADLPEGAHAITLRTADPGNLVHEDDVTVEIVDAPQTPVIQIIHPTAGDLAEEGAEFLFEATVDDPQEGPEALEVTVTSDLDDLLCLMEVNVDGDATCRAVTRTVGLHRITFEAKDADGNTGRQTTTLPVEEVPEAPTIQVRAPSTGDRFLAGAFVTFEATVSDRQDDPPDLTVTVASDLDGPRCFLDVDPSGDAACSSVFSTLGNHELLFRVTDTDGNSTDRRVLVSVVDETGIDDDGDGYAEVDGDCDDTRTDVYPGAPELPDGRDNDCDSTADEGTVLYDDDGDGYCESTTTPCTDGTLLGDCDDARPAINPGADEVCGSGRDEDCDGQTDDLGAIGCTDFWQDADADTFGDPALQRCQCAPSSPYTALNDDDCDDTRGDVYPGAPELEDGVDNDCDGDADDGTRLYDDDGDGYCESTGPACTDGSLLGDCDDSLDTVSPAGTEICGNGRDDDCDGTQDEDGAIGCTDWYPDADRDGAGDPAFGVCACARPPTGTWVQDDRDCDDSDPAIRPGAPELADRIDNDCDGLRDEGTIYYDDDGDGFCEDTACTPQTTGPTARGGDCDDARFDVNPDAPEVCGGGVDEDCSGDVDDGLGAIGCLTYYEDVDRDGFGTLPSACLCAPAGPYRVRNDDDCWDGNPDAYPGQTLWFTGDRGDGSYDYNCNGFADRRWIDKSTCGLEIATLGTVCRFQPGWDGEPGCGNVGEWVTDCRTQVDGSDSDFSQFIALFFGGLSCFTEDFPGWFTADYYLWTTRTQQCR